MNVREFQSWNSNLTVNWPISSINESINRQVSNNMPGLTLASSKQEMLFDFIYLSLPAF